MAQTDLFDLHPEALPPPPVDESVAARTAARVARVRRYVRQTLDLLHDADEMPWDARDLLYHRTMMPQTTRNLPDDERTDILREFDAHLARLGG